MRTGLVLCHARPRHYSHADGPPLPLHVLHVPRGWHVQRLHAEAR